MSKHQKQIALEARQRLVECYPLTFMPKGALKKPLKIGIFNDLITDKSHGLSRNRITIALRDYCRGAGYFVALIEGAPRFDLQGQRSGEVTKPQADKAADEMQRAGDATREKWQAIAQAVA